MSFTTVTASLTVGQIGQLGYGADSDLLVRSYALQDATAIPPGRAVCYDATNDSILLPTAGKVQFMGVAFDDGTLPIETASYSATGVAAVPVLKRGSVWVLTSEAVTPASAVYQQHDGSGSGAAGSFRTDNDGGKATVISAGAQWAGSYDSGKALLQINLPA